MVEINEESRKYDLIDRRIGETYIKDSDATLRMQLYDPYVKFFRWATDRLQGRDGIVCFVSNNSFVVQIAFDSMRKHLYQDFTRIYHVDLHGNVRKNPKLSGTTHNVFGIQVGVGITLAVRSAKHGGRRESWWIFCTQEGKWTADGKSTPLEWRAHVVQPIFAREA